MKKLLITIILLFNMNLFGQTTKFDEISREVLEQIDKMGIDDLPLLNGYESAYFNVIFEKNRYDFDFTNKQIFFFTGSSGNKKSSKKEYFKGEKERFYRNSTTTNGTLYIFNAAQKVESGGYDATIVYWSKFLLPIEKVIANLNRKEK